MIEDIICEHLQNNAELMPLLASYDGKPAVFHYKVPEDNDPKWQGEPRYGRLAFLLRYKTDFRQRGGSSLFVNVLSEQSTQLYKDIEPIVRNHLDGYFFVSDEQIISLQWNQTMPLTGEFAETASGVIMKFRVYSYPIQSFLEENPVSLMTAWSKAYMEILGREAYVIGSSDILPTVFKPTIETPALYWRLAKVSPCGWMKDTPAADWRTAWVRGHVIIPGCSEAEIALALKIDRAIERAERISDDDLSIFVSRENEIDATVNSMRTGQLTVAATFGITSEREESEKLQNISVKMN